MEPEYKAPSVNKILDTLTGRPRGDSIRSNICVICGKPATDFTDSLSRQEFAISGLCQVCQDVAFRDDDEEEG